tara:strand:- start:5498 stop:7270 length:1773 start_codon:yes stop_codon:yes gene_type:complete
MSAEHITNQTHLNKILREESAQIIATKLSKDLDQENKQQKVPKIETNDLTDLNNVQRLLSQQSEQTKQHITKKSLESMQHNGHIHNAELEDEINRELTKFFEPKTSIQDKTTLSKEYYQNNDIENAKESVKDNRLLDQLAGSKAQQKDTKKVKEDAFNALTQDTQEDNFDEVLLKHKQQSNDSNNVKEKRMTLLNQRDLKEYAKQLTKFALTSDPNAKQAIEKQKQTLMQKGLSINDINFMASKIGQVMKQHMVYDLKQQLINVHMSKGFSKQEHLQYNLQFNSASTHLEGLKNQGRLNADLSDTVNQLRHQAKQDLGNFLYEESVNQFTKQTLGQMSLQKFTEELVKLQKAAQSAGVDISEKELTEKIFSAIDNLGLAEFSRPDTNSKNQQKQPERFITQEEALDDKLRYLYMIKALHPSLRHKIDTHFKMKKCRNGMIKLGFYTEEKEHHLKKQGEFLAANQFKEELGFLFREEATLPHLTGAEYGVIRKKKAFFLSQLRKVDHGMNANEIDRMKQNMYREMYGLMKEELLQLKEMAEIRKHVGITRKVKHLQEVVKRIQETIPVHDFKSNIHKLIAPVNNQTINEGA